MERMELIRQMMGAKVHVIIDRPMGYLHGDILYPVNYGYIPGILAGDGEDQDAYVLGIDEPLEEFDGYVIGAICRKNDVEDKLVVAPEGMVLNQAQIAQAVHFQEQYFDTYIHCQMRLSCGVLPWRKENGQREYLLVFEEFSQCWSLPKGHMEMGESQTQTALRELYEETGLTAQLDENHWATIEYPINSFSRKQVVIYPGKVRGTPRICPGEIGKCKWVTEQELETYLHPDTVEACRKIIACL